MGIHFDYDKCIGCGESFDHKLVKTKHHIYPGFLSPKIKATIPLCRECHKKLNESYIHVIKKGEKISPENLTGDFKKFIDTYHKLKSQFQNNKIHRGEFGEGLWSNLVGYLSKIEERLK